MLKDADVIVVVLADQPWLTAARVMSVVDAWDSEAAAVRETFAGRPGHPVLIARALYPAVAALRGDRGAGDLLTGAIEVECGPEVVADVDTPDDLR